MSVFTLFKSICHTNVSGLIFSFVFILCLVRLKRDVEEDEAGCQQHVQSFYDIIWQYIDTSHLWNKSSSGHITYQMVDMYNEKYRHIFNMITDTIFTVLEETL